MFIFLHPYNFKNYETSLDLLFEKGHGGGVGLALFFLFIHLRHWWRIILVVRSKVEEWGALLKCCLAFKGKN